MSKNHHVLRSPESGVLHFAFVRAGEISNRHQLAVNANTHDHVKRGYSIERVRTSEKLEMLSRRIHGVVDFIN